MVDLSSAAACQNSFYDAFSNRNLDAMREIWSQVNDVVCVHPGSMALTGYDAIMRGWEQILGADRMQVSSSAIGEWHTDAISTFTVTEHLHVPERNVRGEALATNVFQLEDGVWRMVLHHGSPKPAPARSEPDEGSGTVH